MSNFTYQNIQQIFGGLPKKEGRHKILVNGQPIKVVEIMVDEEGVFTINMVSLIDDHKEENDGNFVSPVQ